MTTIVDPAGTPVVVYNKGGTTIVEIIAAGSTQGSATPIVAYSGTTVVLADPDGSDDKGVLLPADADIGDMVEIHSSNTAHAIHVFPPSGEAIASLSVNEPMTSVYVRIFRKTSASQWFYI